MELRLDRISEHYGGARWGLRDLSMRIRPGVLGLLGPNGAGKSTLMRIIATIARPSAGSLHWNGVDLLQEPEAIRSVLGYLPQDFGLYEHLNAVEFLHYMAAAKGLSGPVARARVADLLELVNLTHAAKRRLGTYSGGMRQRVGIAQALLNDPLILIADEPTVGLDPEERVRFRELLSDLAGDRIILLSSHVVPDIEAVATRIAILHEGSLIVDAPPEELLRLVAGKVWEWTVPSDELPLLRQRYQISAAVRSGEGVRSRVVADQVAGPLPVEPTLEDAYLYLVGRAKQRGGGQSELADTAQAGAL